MRALDVTTLENCPHPIAIVNANGELVTSNPAGEKQWQTLATDCPQSFSHIKNAKPLQFMIQGGHLLKGTPLMTDNLYQLEWQSLDGAELRLALLQDVSKAVNSSLILEDIFNSLASVLQAFLPFDSGTIVILDETQNSIKVLVNMDPDGQAYLHGNTKVFTGYDSLIHDLLRRPQPRLLSAPFDDSVLAVFANMNSQSALLVPLISKGVMIGCISLFGKHYTPVHLQLLEDVSEHLAVAVENARLYWQTQNQAGREFLINQITKAIRQSLNIQRILQTTVQEIGQVMGLSRCIIHYWNTVDNQFEAFEYVLPGVLPVEDSTQLAQFEKNLFLQRSDSPQRYNPFILNDVRSFTGHLELLEKETIKSLAVFPILLEETSFVGTISLHQCDTYRAWLGEEIDLLMAIAEHLALALHQANLFQEKENQRQQLENTLIELQRAQMQLIQSEKMAVLGQFVAGIAHEVNTPLGTLVANDDTVKRCLEQMNTSSEKDAKFRQSALELLRINQMASERIQEIVRNLRNFARLDESDLKHIDLHEGLETTLVLIRSSMSNAIAIEREYGELPLIECFPGLLNQVFMNILVNAIHSLDGQGTITIQTGLGESGTQAHIRIRDTGKGIAPDHLHRIFDPGFTTKGVGVGTGLGLALCYQIMQKHHGHISVDSTVGKGTTMTVTLPIKQPVQPG